MTNLELLNLVRDTAQEKWGDRWMAETVRAYCEVAQRHGDQTATVTRRRPSLERAFKNGSCTVDTLLNLFDAVGLQMRIIKISQQDITP
jgi:DNA-binding phage protein